MSVTRDWKIAVKLADHNAADYSLDDCMHDCFLAAIEREWTRPCTAIPHLFELTWSNFAERCGPFREPAAYFRGMTAREARQHVWMRMMRIPAHYDIDNLSAPENGNLLRARFTLVDRRRIRCRITAMPLPEERAAAASAVKVVVDAQCASGIWDEPIDFDHGFDEPSDYVFMLLAITTSRISSGGNRLDQPIAPLPLPYATTLTADDLVAIGDSVFSQRIPTPIDAQQLLWRHLKHRAEPYVIEPIHSIQFASPARAAFTLTPQRTLALEITESSRREDLRTRATVITSPTIVSSVDELLDDSLHECSDYIYICLERAARRVGSALAPGAQTRFRLSLLNIQRLCGPFTGSAAGSLRGLSWWNALRLINAHMSRRKTPFVINTRCGSRGGRIHATFDRSPLGLIRCRIKSLNEDEQPPARSTTRPCGCIVDPQWS